MAQKLFEIGVVTMYFALLALPIVGIVVGLKYFPPGDNQEEPAPDTEKFDQETSGT